MTTARANREPAFYIDSQNPAFNAPDREFTYTRDGKIVREKKPQAGHLGTHIDDMQRMRGEGARYITVVKTTGNVVRLVLTSAAGDMDPNSQLAMHVKAKARHYGWFRFGTCPCALLRTGEMLPDHFVEKSLIHAQPCEPGTYSLQSPCPHALAERHARQDAHNATQAKYFEPGAAEKAHAATMAAQQAMIDAQRALVAELTKSAPNAKSAPTTDAPSAAPTKGK